MSDLNAFFAKKDRRKRRSKTSKPSPTSQTTPLTNNLTQLSTKTPRGPRVAPSLKPVPSIEEAGIENEGVKEEVEDVVGSKKSNDGWIELEEEGTAQVHTGGRRIMELKRDEEGVIIGGDGDGDGEEGGDVGDVKEMTEKFAGWQSKVDDGDGEGGEGEEGVEGKVRGVDKVVEEGKFPTLAETKDAPLVPASAGKYGVSSEFKQRRPANIKFAGLQKLAERLREQNEGAGRKVGAVVGDSEEKEDTVAEDKVVESANTEGGKKEDVVDEEKKVDSEEEKKDEAPKSGLQRLLEKKASGTSVGAKRQFPGLKAMLKKKSEEKETR